MVARFGGRAARGSASSPPRRALGLRLADEPPWRRPRRATDDREIYQLVLAFLAESPGAARLRWRGCAARSRRAAAAAARGPTPARRRRPRRTTAWARRALRELLRARCACRTRSSARTPGCPRRRGRCSAARPARAASRRRARRRRASTRVARCTRPRRRATLAAPARDVAEPARARPALPPSRDVAVMAGAGGVRHAPRVAACEARPPAAASRAQGYAARRQRARHLNPAFCCAFDRTGERVATGSDDFNVKLWSSRTGVLQYVLRGHRGEITDLAISADNTQLASASNDGTIRLWRLRDGVPIAVWAPEMGHPNQVINAVDFYGGRAALAALRRFFQGQSLGSLRLREAVPPPSAAAAALAAALRGHRPHPHNRCALDASKHAAGMRSRRRRSACGCGALDDTGNYAAVGAAGWPHLFMWPLHDARAHLGGGDSAPQRDSRRARTARAPRSQGRGDDSGILKPWRPAAVGLTRWHGAPVVLARPSAFRGGRRARESRGRGAAPRARARRAGSRAAVRVNMVAWARDDSRCITAETLHKTTMAAPCLEAFSSLARPLGRLLAHAAERRRRAVLLRPC